MSKKLDQNQLTAEQKLRAKNFQLRVQNHNLSVENMKAQIKAKEHQFLVEQNVLQTEFCASLDIPVDQFDWNTLKAKVSKPIEVKRKVH